MTFQCIYECSDEGGENGAGKKESEVYRRRGLKVNAGKSKVMVLNGKEGLECDVYVTGFV